MRQGRKKEVKVKKGQQPLPFQLDRSIKFLRMLCMIYIMLMLFKRLIKFYKNQNISKKIYTDSLVSNSISFKIFSKLARYFFLSYMCRHIKWLQKSPTELLKFFLSSCFVLHIICMYILKHISCEMSQTILNIFLKLFCLPHFFFLVK